MRYLALCCQALMMLIAITEIAHAENLVVIVNPQSGITQLSNTDVMQIFMGKTPVFPNGKTARPVYMIETSPLRTLFDRKALNKDTIQVRAFWVRMLFTGRAEPPSELADSTSVKQRIAGDSTLIGYVTAEDVGDTVRIVYRVP